jgi:hypothetical protein
MEKENLFSKEKLEELAKAFYDEYLKYKELEKKLQKKDSELFEKYQAVNGKEHRKEKNALWEECNRVNVEEIFPNEEKINGLYCVYDAIQDLLKHCYKD